MKVSELIEKLKYFDPDSLVVTGGFDEAGYADIRNVSMIYVKERASESAKEILGVRRGRSSRYFSAFNKPLLKR